MNIQPINNSQSRTNNAASFKANAWVDKSVESVIKSSKDTFVKAAEHFDAWLRNEQGHVNKTLTIRKNTSLNPKVVLERWESHTSYAYPHEETGHTVQERVKKYEDLEFDLEGRKCGFWFDPASSVYKLVADFKNMFNYLQNGK